MCGLWFGAYAADGRAEANRVCAWIGNGYDDRRPFYEAQPGDGSPVRLARNRPGLVQPWIDFGYLDQGNECTCLVARDKTIRLGVKMKAVSDPELAALVDFYLACSDPVEYWGVLDVAQVGVLAGLFNALVWRFEQSPWYETMVEVTEVFGTAWARGLGVRFG
jgi:hypothetical protein